MDQAKKRDPLREISGEITRITGVQLGEKQFSMVESRISRRMSELGIKELDAYHSHYLANRESETNVLISLLTTHHTYFFREFHHFEFLIQKGLPDLVKSMREKGETTLRVWSAACSHGQEVYTICMFLEKHLKALAADFKYEILGTDVDPESVKIAQNGVYRWDDVKEIPAAYLQGAWARGTGDIAAFAKIKSHIKANCRFHSANLLSIPSSIATKPFHIIFCRNVFIYFSPDQIKSSVSQMLNHLDKSGYFFIGLSESLNGLGLSVAHAGPSVYTHRKLEAVPSAGPTVATRSPVSKPQLAVISGGATQENKILKVLCVDDSPTVLALLKKILQRESGFEVVATAKDGLEAAAALKKHSVDLVTLDIHMPNQDGIEYLTKNFKPGHPPVVMVSSVSREQADLALKSMELGASDYVEKPTMSNLDERGEEIRNKLKIAWSAKSENHDLSLERSFADRKKLTYPDPAKSLRAVIFGVKDATKVAELCKGLGQDQTPLVLMTSDSLDVVEKALEKAGKKVARVTSFTDSISPGSVSLCSVKQEFSALVRAFGSKRKLSLFVTASQSAVASPLVKKGEWKESQFILEDGAQQTIFPADRVIPVTSYPFHSIEFLCGREGASK